MPILVEIRGGHRGGGIPIFVQRPDPEFPVPVSEQQLQFVVAQGRHQIHLTVTVEIPTGDGDRRPVDGIQPVFLERPTTPPRENRNLVAPGTGDRQILVRVAVEVQDCQVPRFLTHANGDLRLEAPIPVPEQKRQGIRRNVTGHQVRKAIFIEVPGSYGGRIFPDVVTGKEIEQVRGHVGILGRAPGQEQYATQREEPEYVACHQAGNDHFSTPSRIVRFPAWDHIRTE